MHHCRSLSPQGNVLLWVVAKHLKNERVLLIGNPLPHIQASRQLIRSPMFFSWVNVLGHAGFFTSNKVIRVTLALPNGWMVHEMVNALRIWGYATNPANEALVILTGGDPFFTFHVSDHLPSPVLSSRVSFFPPGFINLPV